MNKVPYVERDALTGGITIPCASLWYAFLSEEAYWRDEVGLAQEYKRRSESLSGGLRGSLHSRELEECIKRWKRTQ